MKRHRKKTVGNRLLVAVWRYVTFFSVMAFSITGCMILFLRITERELGLIYTEDKISHNHRDGSLDSGVKHTDGYAIGKTVPYGTQTGQACSVCYFRVAGSGKCK